MVNKKVKQIMRDYQLYLMLILPMIYIIIFHYVPMYGIQIAFKNYRIAEGITRSPWIGFDHFIRFFKSYEFKRTLINTLTLSIYSIVAGFPFPIILALCLNYVKNTTFKRLTQTVSYAPNFISVVVLVGMMVQFLNLRYGIVNNMLDYLGFNRIDFLGEPKFFSSLYVWSGVWQGVGFGSIVYSAALSAIDISLHEAAIIDGANKIQRMWYIDLPGIAPTIVTLLILRTGSILSVGFEKVLLMQNTLNLKVSEVISTYVYKVGLSSPIPNYSYATAIGLFQSLVGFILLCFVNWVAKKIGEWGVW